MADSNGKQMNPFMAGLGGAVVGAGIAMITTKVLMDKKTRNKITDAISHARHNVANSMNNISRQINEKRKTAEERTNLQLHLRPKRHSRTKETASKVNLKRR